jgi:hypothetical protein
MGALKRIIRVIPGPAVTYAQSWTSLFAETHFANPEWRISAENEGVVLGAIIMVVAALLSTDKPSRFLKIVAGCLFGITVLLLASCRFIYFLLGPPEPGAHTLNATWWNEVWSMLYTAAIVSLIATISFAVLSEGEKKSRVWWFVGGSILILLACIAVYFVWFR